MKGKKPGPLDWVKQFAADVQSHSSDVVEKDIQNAVLNAQRALQGKTEPTPIQTDRDRGLLLLSRKFTEEEIRRMSPAQIAEAADGVRAGGFDPPDVIKAANEVLIEAKGAPSDARSAWVVARKAREALDEADDLRRAEETAQLRDVLSRNTAFDKADIDQLGRDRLLYEVRKEAERLSMGVENSREDPSAIAGAIADRFDRETRDQLQDLVESLGDGRWTRSAIDQLGDRDLARIGEKLLRDLDGTSTSPGPGGGSGGGGSDGTGRVIIGHEPPGVRVGPWDGGAGDPLLTGPGAGLGTDTATGTGTGTGTGGTGGTGPGGGASAGEPTGTQPGPGGSGEPAPPDDQGGWTYLGTGVLDETGETVEVWMRDDGSTYYRSPDGTVAATTLYDENGVPIGHGSTTVGGSGSGGDGQQGGGTTTGSGSGSSSGSGSTGDEDDSDSGSDSGSDSTDDGDGTSSGSAGEQGTGAVESTPVDDVNPRVKAITELGRAFGFHSGPQRAPATSGDVDPADPHSTERLDVSGPIVDLKQRLLIGPSDPDVVGGTRSGRLPDAITRAGAGVTDPTDDAGRATGVPGREDDPFSSLRPPLEPSADPDADPDPDDGDGDGVTPLSHLGLLRDLDLGPAGPAHRFGPIGFDDFDVDD